MALKAAFFLVPLLLAGCMKAPQDLSAEFADGAMKARQVGEVVHITCTDFAPVFTPASARDSEKVKPVAIVRCRYLKNTRLLEGNPIEFGNGLIATFKENGSLEMDCKDRNGIVAKMAEDDDFFCQKA